MRENQLKRCQQEAEEMRDILQDNCTKLLDRGGNLSDLDERADKLRKQSSTFAKTTKPLAKKKPWKNVKGMFILLALAVIAVMVIVTATIL